MEYLEEIYYKIHWENFSYFLAFFFYAFFWLTIITGIRKRSRNFIEYIIRIVAILPFWGLFIYHIAISTAPNSFNHHNSKNFSQKINIHNNTKERLFINFYLRNKRTKKWEIEYNEKFFPILNVNYVNPQETALYSLSADTSKYDYYYIKTIKQFEPSTKYGLALKLTGVNLEIYTNELISEKMQEIKTNYNFEYKLLVLFILAIAFFWYHYFTLLRRRIKIRFVIFGSIFTLYCLTVVLSLARSVLLQDIIGI